MSDLRTKVIDGLAQALTECAPARVGIWAEAEAIWVEIEKNAETRQALLNVLTYLHSRDGGWHDEPERKMREGRA